MASTLNVFIAGVWESVFEKFFEQTARSPDSDSANLGWKRIAQDRVTWLASRPAFVACALPQRVIANIITLVHMKGLIVGNTRHFDNEIDLAGSEGLKA